MFWTDRGAINAVTDAALAAGGSSGCGPMRNYRLINLPQEA